MLITVDTSIKHLGSATETPIIEFAHGGSLPHQTGVFSDNALIFEVQSWDVFNSREEVTKVAQSIHSILNHEKPIRHLGLQGANVYRPVFINHATCFLKDMAPTSVSQVGDDLLLQALRIGEIDAVNGGEDVSLASSLAFSIADSLKSNLHELKVGFSEVHLGKMQDLAHSSLVAIQKAHDNLDRVFSGRIHFLDWLEDCQSSFQGYFPELVEKEVLQFSPGDRVVDISEIRRIQQKLDLAHRRENWNLKFLRTLHNHMTEKL